MINNNSNFSPVLSYWRCDNYPYYIPSITNIELVKNPEITSTKEIVRSDEFHCILNGSATYEIIDVKNSETTLHTTKKNDVVFFPYGMQYYAINDASDDFEFLKISFFLYTCNNAFVQNSFLNFDEALNSPIQNRRVIPFFPRITTFNNNDEALKYILNIKEFRNFNKTGHILQIQGNLLLLILRVINKSKENHNYIFKNSRIIGISSKYSPFTIMPKGCELYVSDLKIFDSNPNINKPPSKLLSLFTASNNQQFEPKNNNITLSNIYDNKTNRNFLHISANEDTLYHIWIFRDIQHFTADLCSYCESACLQFFAKCNMNLRFGVVIYNPDNDQLISYNFEISPSEGYTEYCIPLLDSNDSIGYSNHSYKVINYIMQNYENKIQINDIAKYIHMSPSHTATKFKQEMGISINDYILDYRLTIAKKMLLEQPKMSISEIALACGFYDSAHFSNSFKKTFKMTAKEYRNKLT